MRTSEPSLEPSYGRYETLFRIASGGMAEVYAARARGEAGFEKLVALKRMLPHLSGDERFVTMFMDEARLAANIASPHVVSTLDLGRASDGSLYLVMELVVGVTLHALARNVSRAGGPVPVPIAVELLAQAAQGLHDAHEACTPTGSSLEIVHRDVSPQNILVGVDGRARLTDFGIARATERSTQTSTGEFKGKLAYSSPEQCANEPLDRRADIFSLAIVGWELLTGERLFYAETPLGILENVTRSEIREVAAVRPEVPRAISGVIARGLRRKRDERFATAGDFERALRTAARASGAVAAPSAVAALVRAHGGDALARIEQRLRTSLTPSTSGGLAAEAPRASFPPPPPPSLHDERTVITPPPAAIAAQLAGPAPEAIAPQLAGPPLTAAPAPARRLPLAIALLVILCAGGVAGWLSLESARSEDQTGVASAAAPEPAREASASADAPAGTPPSDEAAAAAPDGDQRDPGAAAEVHDAAHERRASRRSRTKRSAASRPEPASQRATAEDPPSPPIRRAETAVAPPPPPAAPSRPAEPRAAAPRAHEAPPRTERPRRSGLLSIDEFERDLGSQ